MFRLLKNLNKKEVICILICIVFITLQVWLDLKLPDYMSEITKLVQSKDSEVINIVKQGGFMLSCAAGSVIFAFITRIFSSICCSITIKKVKTKYI